MDNGHSSTFHSTNNLRINSGRNTILIIFWNLLLTPSEKNQERSCIKNWGLGAGVIGSGGKKSLKELFKEILPNWHLWQQRGWLSLEKQDKYTQLCSEMHFRTLDSIKEVWGNTLTYLFFLMLSFCIMHNWCEKQIYVY